MKSMKKYLYSTALVGLMSAATLCVARPINLQDAKYKNYIREFKIAHMLFKSRGMEPSEAFKEVYNKIEKGEFIVDSEVMQQAFLNAKKSMEGLL